MWPEQVKHFKHIPSRVHWGRGKVYLAWCILMTAAESEAIVDTVWEDAGFRLQSECIHGKGQLAKEASTEWVAVISLAAWDSSVEAFSLGAILQVTLVQAGHRKMS